jgi:methionine-gamma-lyase
LDLALLQYMPDTKKILTMHTWYPSMHPSTYVYDTAEQGMRRFSGEEPGYIYSRWGNPTITEAEEKIAALESFGLGITVKGILHASGMQL